MMAVLFTALLAGCATNGVNLAANGTVRIQVESAAHVEFADVYVRQYADELLVHAQVRPREAVKFFYPGHLRFVMTDGNGGTLWDLDVTRYRGGHHDHGANKMKHASFWVRMPFVPPTGSVLTVSQHTREGEDAEPGAQGLEPGGQKTDGP